MNWRRIKLIFTREMRDQIRDRCTMFTIVVLPMLLYPFMGMLMLQVAQFHHEHPVRIDVIGNDHWPVDSPLQLATDNTLIEWRTVDDDDLGLHRSNPIEQGKQLLSDGKTDLVLIVPKDFHDLWKSMTKVPVSDGDAHQSKRFVSTSLGSSGESNGTTELSIADAKLTVVYNQTFDLSKIASQRLSERLQRWHHQWIRDQIATTDLGDSVLDPLPIEAIDLAATETKHALVWSKLLPLVMLVWALTGAFYPAIDLCAGEKERGTLETLLCSPATRREIVWGKLLTIMFFSVGTAVLNLFSMQVTSSFVIEQFSKLGSDETMQSLGPLSLSALSWLIIILLPISAMFSALALAVAALARSSKEGQYYLMPLLLGGLPLVMLPMIPGIVLTAGTASIPVTGAVLLARALIEGQYAEASMYAPIVAGVTIVCCLLAVRWAVRQFESESVLFRESDRFQLKAWLLNVFQTRSQTATANEAIFCGILILVALFFGRMTVLGTDLDWNSITRSTIAIQIGMILAPCLIMATVMTRSVRKALRLNSVRPLDCLLAIVLGISLNPIYGVMSSIIQSEFALGEDTKALMVQIDQMLSAAPLWSVILVLAVIPALCEEIAFRGFIFAGLSRQNGTLRAIVLSALFFGLSHGVLQQSIGASIVGLLLGLVAWRTGGIACTIIIHLIHNSLSMSIPRLSKQNIELSNSMQWVFEKTSDGGIAYSDFWLRLCCVIAVLTVAFMVFRPVHQANTASID